MIEADNPEPQNIMVGIGREQQFGYEKDLEIIGHPKEDCLNHVFC